LGISTAGRSDVDDYFRKSGVLTARKLPHTPFLVFVENANDIEVRIVDNVHSLLGHADSTKVMGQWSGQWRSDFFQFTVGDVRKFVSALQLRP
jgi:hypothetical protein